MATTPRPFPAAALATKTVWATNTTLFQVAATELGNAMYWVAIAAINGIIDPWITDLVQLKIPVIFDKTNTTGVFDPVGSFAPQQQTFLTFK